MLGHHQQNGKTGNAPAPEQAADVREVPLSEILLTGGTQVRAAMCEATVDRYAEAMKAGQKFPPVVVYAEDDDPSCLWLSDGFHRLTGAARIGRTTILAEVRAGGLRAAFLYALQANVCHGLPMSNKDKRAAALAAIQKRDSGLIDASDREIARLLGVSNALVSTIRQEREWAIGVLTVNTEQVGRKKGFLTHRGLTVAERRDADAAAERLTWGEMVRLRPALAELLAEAKAIADSSPPDHCFSRTAFGQLVGWPTCEMAGDPSCFLTRLAGLVGSYAPGPPVLCTWQAFHLALDTVLGGLPLCHATCECGHPNMGDPEHVGKAKWATWAEYLARVRKTPHAA